MSVSIAAGDLTERITLQARVAGVDARGQESNEWADAVTVWAQSLPIRGREFFAASQIQSEVAVRFRIRWRSGVAPTMRVMWRSQAHDIDSVIDVEGRRVVLELMCLAGVKDGR